MDKGEEYRVEFVIAGKHAPKTPESAVQALHRVAMAGGDAVVRPGSDPVGVGRHDGYKARVYGELVRGVAFVGAVQAQGATERGCRAQALEQFASFGRIARLAGCKRHLQGTPNRRGHQTRRGCGDFCFVGQWLLPIDAMAVLDLARPG